MGKEQKRVHVWTQLEPAAPVDGTNIQMRPSAERKKLPRLSFYEKTHLGGHEKEKKKKSKLLLYI